MWRAQTNQGSSKSAGDSIGRVKRSIFSHSVLSVHMGPIQILPMEAVVDLLEKS
jgi:hypothetical protein